MKRREMKRREMKIHIDEKDIAIIFMLWGCKLGMTSYSLAKKLYPDLKDEYTISKKSIPIKARVEKLSRYGFLMNKIAENKRYYLVNKKNLKIGSGNLNFKYKYGSNNISMEQVVLMKSTDDPAWRIIQVL